MDQKVYHVRREQGGTFRVIEKIIYDDGRIAETDNFGPFVTRYDAEKDAEKRTKEADNGTAQ